jgi:hypothetical protein
MKAQSDVKNRAARSRVGLSKFVLCSVTTASALALGVSLWTRAQSAGEPADAAIAPTTPTLPPEPSDPALARYAILNPHEYNAAVEALRTPEVVQARAGSRWAFENPAEHFAQVVAKDPNYARQKAEADLAILNPVEATARIKERLTPEQQAENDRVAFEIEHPEVRP